MAWLEAIADPIRLGIVRELSRHPEALSELARFKYCASTAMSAYPSRAPAMPPRTASDLLASRAARERRARQAPGALIP